MKMHQQEKFGYTCNLYDNTFLEQKRGAVCVPFFAKKITKRF